MRSLLAVLAFLLLPLGANAATIGDFNGQWLIDPAATLEKSPGVTPDEDFLQIRLFIDARGKGMRTEFPGHRGVLVPFTVERESADEVIINRADGKILKFQSHGSGRFSIGELKNGAVHTIMYFRRK